MKRKFAVMAVLGALAALALPASSMAGGMYPASAKFEMTGVGRIETALGGCQLGKVTGQIPAAPNNQLQNPPLAVSAPPVLSCSTGTSLTIGGSSWQFQVAGAYEVILMTPASERLVLRFSSLPGCKLTGSVWLTGNWSNGVNTSFPVPSGIQLVTAKSGFHPHGFNTTLTWANDGATCALAGKAEPVSYTMGISDTAGTIPVNNLTSPSTPIYVTGF